MSTERLNNPNNWRKRGEEIRRFADETENPHMKAQLLKLAADYEHLAQKAEERAGGTKLATWDSRPSATKE